MSAREVKFKTNHKGSECNTAGGDESGHESEESGAPHYDLFDSFKPENNTHRTFESNPGDK